jgi:hypothetical protein
MKKQSVILLTLVILCVFGLSMAAIKGHDAVDTPQVPADAIGQPNSNGPPTIFTDKLVTTFEDGGSIVVFDIVNLSGNWKLLRKGTLGGNRRTEVVPIVLSAGYYRFHGPVWYVVCDLAANSCAAPAFCNPNTTNTACVCANGGNNCNFGGSSGQLYDTEVLR